MLTHFDLKKSTSVHILPLTGTNHEPDLLLLEELIEYSAQLLPPQGPVGAFVFQNPLHALEYLPFDQAVLAGARLFGGQPCLPEARYREELRLNRIQVSDLRSVLEEEPAPWHLVNNLSSRLHLRMAMLMNRISAGSAAEIDWYMAETEALTHFPPGTGPTVRRDIVADVKRWVVRDLINAGSPNGRYRNPLAEDPRRQHILWPLLHELDPVMHGGERGYSDDWADPIWESFALKSLWRVCREGVRKAGPRQAPEPTRGERPRDLLLWATGIDTDQFVHALLIRFCAAFTDQGVAHWALPGRELGFFKCFRELYRTAGGPPERWLQGLSSELERLRRAGLGPMDSIRESLDLLGITEEEWDAFLPATLLALRGWASMIRQMEVRSDRVHLPVPRGTLIEFLAVRLILERLALSHVAEDRLGYTGPLAKLRVRCRRPIDRTSEQELVERAFPIFQLALASGWAPSTLHAFSALEWQNLLEEVEKFSDLERRRVFHKAYELRLRIRALDAIGTQTSGPPRGPELPQFQTVSCLDAREESFRRHLEEICPAAETFGAAGFFGVPMYYRGVADAFPAAQCPIVIRPQHWVVEEPAYPLTETHQTRARARHFLGAVSHQLHAASRGGALGALVSGLLGSLALVPLVARVLFPRWVSWISHSTSSLIAPPRVTRLVIERTTPAPGPEEGAIGFNLEEMTNISERFLRDIGLTERFSRLVLFFGHASRSLNNPHLAAYHCGACSGNPGGANARALAVMLNDHRVRNRLAARGLDIPEDTVFLGGQHNTGDETVTFYDLDLLPRTHYKDLQAAREFLEQACERNARERCRRFDSAPLNITQESARRHAHARTEDLAQTRPEFGNASNALCIVGRRNRIRGLFLDRRSFLQSYDPTQDTPQGTILARILSAVVPVCQGINLEYYLSSVDSSKWGSGSKLPHNVTGMLGVMDGAASDLRLGLPWQGVEIHEPVRLLFVVETHPETMLAIMAGNPVIDRVIRNGWSQLAILDPESSKLLLWSNGKFEQYQPTNSRLPSAASSAEWYNGSREHLDFADIKAASV